MDLGGTVRRCDDSYMHSVQSWARDLVDLVATMELCRCRHWPMAIPNRGTALRGIDHPHRVDKTILSYSPRIRHGSNASSNYMVYSMILVAGGIGYSPLSMMKDGRITPTDRVSPFEIYAHCPGYTM